MSRILLVDDDDLLLELLDFKLSARGYDVVTATDGPSGVEAAYRSQPDLIVLDAMMPGFDGFVALRQLRGDPRTAGIPVVMLTARKQESDIVTALQAGARDYLVKPFIPEELLTRIQRILSEGQAINDNRAIA